MKNLKRALSFAVAAIMLVGLMAVGTSAFTDDADIENTEAVNIMNQLGIILGKPDGSFDPTATVSRAEMAKMICVALNGGKDPKLESEGTLYPDTKGNWAAGYIDYCTNLGIVAGSTDGNFYPSNPVTGTEAAKMILIALGYDAKNEKFVNDANWSLNINIRANQKDLYNELAILPGAPLSRDNAAQMIFNGMDAEMVEYDYQLNTVDGNLVSVAVAKDQTGKTIMTEKFNLSYFTATLTDADYDEDKDEYTYTYAGAQDENGVAYTPVAAQKKNSADFSDLYRQQVKVLFKNDSSKKMYGMYAYESSVVAEATVADVDMTTYDAIEGTVEVDGTEIEIDSNTIAVYEYLTATNTALNTYVRTATNEVAFTIKFIDDDGDDKADLAVVFPFVVTDVTYVGKTTVTTSAGTFSFEDDNIYTGIAKEDWVVVTAAANTTGTANTLTKAPSATGKVEATKGTTGVKIGGEWYTDLKNNPTTMALNKSYDFVAVNGYIYDYAETEEELTIADVLYVVAANAPGTAGSLEAGTQKVKVMFTDGTTATVTVDKVTNDPTAALAAPVVTTNEVAPDTLYTFATDKDGNYELTAIDPTDYDANFTAYTGNVDEERLNAYRFNDDAVLFVKDSNNDITMVKGADVKKWGTTAVNGAALYAEKKDGYNYAVVGMMTVTGSVPSAADGTGYGLIVDTTTKVKVGTDVYAEITIWNGTEQVVVRALDSSDGYATGITYADLVKGQLISYTKLADNKVENVDKVGTAGAVTGYDGTYVAFSGVPGEYEIDEDTVVIYIDSAKVAGVEGGKIALATETNVADVYDNNVYYILKDATTVKVLFVDVNNELDDAVFGA